MLCIQVRNRCSTGSFTSSTGVGVHHPGSASRIWLGGAVSLSNQWLPDSQLNVRFFSWFPEGGASFLLVGGDWRP